MRSKNGFEEIVIRKFHDLSGKFGFTSFGIHKSPRPRSTPLSDSLERETRFAEKSTPRVRFIRCAEHAAFPAVTHHDREIISGTRDRRALERGSPVIERWPSGEVTAFKSSTDTRQRNGS